MSTTFPIEVTTTRLAEFLAGPSLGTIRTISVEEIGRDVYKDPSPTLDDAAGVIMLMMALEGQSAEDIRAWLHASDEAEAWRNRPPTPPNGGGTGVIQVLHANGVTLHNAAGTRVSLCGYDMFTALRMELDDPSGAMLQPFIEESVHYGFNMWRVFGEASMSENGYYSLDPREPGYYGALDRLASRLTANGIYLLHTCYADNQIYHCGLEHWQQTADVLRPYQDGVFLSGGNQWNKNGWDPIRLHDPGLTWWSRGSGVEDVQPSTPNGSTFVEFHPRRDYPKALDDTVASATYIEFVYKFVLPLIISEPPRMGEDGSGAVYLDAQVCGQFAEHYAAQCAGAVLHMRPGQKGALIPDGSACDRIAETWGAAWRGKQP